MFLNRMSKIYYLIEIPKILNASFDTKKDIIKVCLEEYKHHMSSILHCEKIIYQATYVEYGIFGAMCWYLLTQSNGFEKTILYKNLLYLLPVIFHIIQYRCNQIHNLLIFNADYISGHIRQLFIKYLDERNLLKWEEFLNAKRFKEKGVDWSADILVHWCPPIVMIALITIIKFQNDKSNNLFSAFSLYDVLLFLFNIVLFCFVYKSSKKVQSSYKNLGK